jgi:putative transcriptional regulator
MAVIRRALGLTQEQFTKRFGIPLGTIRGWEQGVAEPDTTAKAYLRAIAGDAEGVAKALIAFQRAAAAEYAHRSGVVSNRSNGTDGRRARRWTHGRREGGNRDSGRP